MKKIITALVAASALVSGLAGTATAAAPAPEEGTHLHLSVSRTVDGQDETGNVWLDCPGIARTGHPHPESACAALDEAGGNFDALPGSPLTRCSDVHSPVTVTAQGTYQGRRVDWTRTYTNECAAHAATGAVFDF
ncbi:SSI family serine proteinase inhibitor [Streptomyces sp. NPDC046275]|uniref:SSI family serine proteinase inhibitor n=1 Tax=Streptomyces sp. NPDC046275 TaxID=3157201 RepID=UPI0033CAC829